MTLVLRGGTVLFPAGPERADVVIDGSRLAGFSGFDGAAGAGVLDASGLTLIPGLIDLQCNGGHGIDLTPDPTRVWELSSLLPAHGVTAWLPTIISSPRSTTDAAIETWRGGRGTGSSAGAEPLGWHFEGPMLRPECRGAHPFEHLRSPDPAVYATWTRANGVALVTLAPELPGAVDAVRTLSAAGVVVSAGHTAADPDQLGAAVAGGLRYVTHLFNAMAPFTHRRPGPAGAALADPSLVVGMIVDGTHLHPVTVAAAWQALGPRRANLVTDGVAALGMPPGTYGLGASRVTVGPDGVRLADGTLAGSNLTAIDAVRNLMAFTGCSLGDAVATMSSVPARLLGCARKGRLEVGADADVVALTPDGHVAATIVAGTVVHATPEAPWRS
jgi:N-acetylglucosamine-6-phosphate deacetylase